MSARPSLKSKISLPTISNMASASSPPKQRPSTPTFYDKASLINTRTLGTSATSSLAIALLGEFLVYTAGTGAVLAHIVEKPSEENNGHEIPYIVETQRFFCTSPKVIGTSVNNDLITQTGSAFTQSRDSNGHLLATKTVSLINNSVLISNDDKSSSASIKDRVKSTKCVAISSDGKLIAVGEVGYQPRILIYSTAPDSTGQALAVMTEHSFGVEALAFSPCGKYLASLGTPNDGFVHIWNLFNLKDGSISLHASNKCTSFVSDMKWMGKRLITAGLRHLRLWSIENTLESSKHCGVLNGRNIVLGGLAQSRLVAIVPLSENVCIISSDRGDICTLQDQPDDKIPLFTPRIKVDIDVTTLDISLDTYSLWIGGTRKSIMHIPLKKLLSLEYEPKVASPSKIMPTRRKNEVAFISNFRANTAIILNSDRDIAVVKVTDIDQDNFIGLCIIESQKSIVPGHTGAITGIGPVYFREKDENSSLLSTADFFTWSKDGIIQFWSQYGDHISSVQFDIPQDGGLDIDNELVSISALHTNPRQLAVGDKLGNLTIIDILTKAIIFSFNAHSTDITSIATAVGKEKEWIVTSSRDRTVQIFARDVRQPDCDWSLHQTLESHRGTIVKVILSVNAEFIYTCSTDRTMGIHRLTSLPRKSDDVSNVIQDTSENQQIMYFISERLITLKSAPTDMILGENAGSLIVSTIDKQIIVFKTVGGELLKTFRTSEGTNELFNLSYIGLLAPNKSLNSERKYLAGLGSDKSIRVYDYGSHNLIATSWAHAEGVTGLMCLQEEPITTTGNKNNSDVAPDSITKFKIISTGQDGCASIWSFMVTNITPSSNKPVDNLSQSMNQTFYHVYPSKTPSRKILSKNEVAALLQKPLKPPPSYSHNHSPPARSVDARSDMIPSSDFSDAPVLRMKSLSLRSPSPTSLTNSPNTATKKMLIPLQSQLQPQPRTGGNPNLRLQRPPMNSSGPAPMSRNNIKSTSIQPEERKAVDNRTINLASPIRSKINMPGMASSVLQTSKASPTSEARSIELLCKDLQQFRDQYSSSIYIEKGGINKLKEELIETIALLDNNYENTKKEEVDMEVILRTFGDKLCKIFEAKINPEVSEGSHSK